MYTHTVDPDPPQQPQRQRVHFDEIFSLSNTHHYSGQLKCYFAIMASLWSSGSIHESRSIPRHLSLAACAPLLEGNRIYSTRGDWRHLSVQISLPVCLSLFLFFCEV